MKSNRIPTRLLLTTVTLGLASCLVPNQKPAEIFADRKDLPKALNDIANPKPVADASTRLPSQVSVAVIDTGVDYNHPDLARQIRFEPGMTGAGKDVFGGDNWAHPSLIDATLFAFGAKSVKDGLVVGAVDSPLQLINKMNSDFMKIFLPLLRAEPRLQSSLFRLIDEENFTLWAATGLIRMWDPKSYESYKKLDKLLNDNKPPRPTATLVDLRTWRDRVELAWMNNLDGGQNAWTPMIEHADVFVAVTERAFKTFDAANGYTAKLETLRAYLKARKEGHTDQELDDKLSDAYRRIATNFVDYAPEVRLAQQLCRRYDAESFRRLRDPQVSDGAKFEIVKAAFEKELRFQSDFIDTYLKSEADSAEDIASAKTAQSMQPFLRKYFAQNISQQERSLFFCDPKRMIKIIDPKILRWAKERNHPFVDGGSETEVHGTHVAGIIARQSPKNRIVPVRIITAGSQQVPAREKSVRRELEEGFVKWLDTYPSALQAAQKKFGTSGKGGVVNKLREYLDEFWEDNSLDIFFFNEMLEAIRYVGEKKIKVANMSLGTTFQQPIDPAVQPQPRVKLQQDGSFVLYEYFKTSVAQAVRDHAPHTLFVIAAGNDGNWVDGRSRSALPCDLTSSFLAEFERTPGAKKVINNDGFRNVLCVGSMNSKDELSHFMNLPITDTPFVLSYGESILAPVKQTSCDFVVNEMEKENKVGSAFFSPMSDGDQNSPVYDELFRKYGFIRGGEPPADLRAARRYGHAELYNSDTILGAVMQAEFYRRCFETKTPIRDHLSGTSMATPAVAGYIARVLATYLRLAKIEEETAYADPRFSPEAIIKHIQEKSPAFGGDSIIKDVRKVTKIRSWPRLTADEAERRLATPVLDIKSGANFQGDSRTWETFEGGGGI